MSLPKPGPWFETRRGWVCQWGGTTTLWDPNLVDAAWAWVAGGEYGFSVYDPEGKVISRDERRIDTMPALFTAMTDCDALLALYMAEQLYPAPPIPTVWERLLSPET